MESTEQNNEISTENANQASNNNKFQNEPSQEEQNTNEQEETDKEEEAGNTINDQEQLFTKDNKINNNPKITPTINIQKEKSNQEQTKNSNNQKEMQNENTQNIDPVKQVDEHQRELIRYDVFKNKEKKRIEEMELTFLQSIALFFRSMFGDEDKIELEYKTQNYKQALQDGTIDKISVLEGEVDNAITTAINANQKRQQEQKLIMEIQEKKIKNKNNHRHKKRHITSLNDVNNKKEISRD